MNKIHKLAIFLLIIAVLLVQAPLWAKLPPQVTLDVDLHVLVTHLKNKDYDAAATVYAKTDKLLAEHDLTVEHGYYYYRAMTMLRTNQIDQAYDSVEKYLDLTGITGRYYKDTLKILIAVEGIRQKSEEIAQHSRETQEIASRQRQASELHDQQIREQMDKQRMAVEQQARDDREKVVSERKARELMGKEERRKAKGISAKTGIEFVYIKGGCFEMGSPKDEKDRESDEGPQHNVCLDDFWMSKYEVTNRQFRRFNASHYTRKFKGQRLNGDTQPVVYVNWLEAAQYTSWISRKSGMEVRLPTEAEWEYAARGGSTTSRFWGDDPDLACRFANVGDLAAKEKWSDWTTHNCDDGYGVAAPVGTYKPNAFGLYDMQGNVWEWCSDWYNEDYYSSSPEKNPQGSKTGSDRIFRGGSWHSKPDVVRGAYRYGDSRDTRKNDLGIRLVLPVGQ